MKIEVVTLPQSSGKVLYGAHVNGYVIAHGYLTEAEARAAAEEWAHKYLPWICPACLDRFRFFHEAERCHDKHSKASLQEIRIPPVTRDP